MAEHCSKIILTNEDPYDEDPGAIVAAIRAGVPERKEQSVQEILDRRAAIRAAVDAAKKGDTVVLTGKGSEAWIMGPQGTREPWSEVAVAKEELAGNIKGLSLNTLL